MQVKINQSPTEQVVQPANAGVTITDPRGRVLVLKKPGVLAQFRLVDVLGAATAKNEVYMGMVLPVIFVSSIDGDPIYQPSSRAQIDALIQRLDEDGLNAVSTAVNEHFGRQDPEADKEALKK